MAGQQQDVLEVFQRRHLAQPVYVGLPLVLGIAEAEL